VCHAPRTADVRTFVADASGQPIAKKEAMDMDGFVNDQNIERFKKLANAATTDAERKTLFGLLAKEQVKFIELQKIRTPPI
jgi:hypothetical protein